MRCTAAEAVISLQEVGHFEIQRIAYAMSGAAPEYSQAAMPGLVNCWSFLDTIRCYAPLSRDWSP